MPKRKSAQNAPNQGAKQTAPKQQKVEEKSKPAFVEQLVQWSLGDTKPFKTFYMTILKYEDHAIIK